MSELPKLRDGSKWMNSCEIQDSSGDVVRILGVCVEIHQDGKYMLSAYASDVLAPLDTNGLNTTANELRKELDEAREKMRFALSCLGVCHRKDAMEALRTALDGEP